MELRLTLLDPDPAGTRVDVSIDAPAGTPFARVSDHLTAALGATSADSGRRFHCARRPVDHAQPLGLPPLLQGAVLTLAHERRRPRPETPPALLEAHVIAGPDAGAVVPLAIGRHSIGRGPGHSLQLTDPDASRDHAELTVGTSRIDLRDTGSTNGTWLGGRRLGSESVHLTLDDTVRIGTGLICVRRPDRPPASALLDGAGHVRINRGPHLPQPRAEVEICFPRAPSERTVPRMPWLAMLLPLVLAVPLAVLWKQPTFLLFAVLTPLLMGGQHLGDRRNGRRETTARTARHQALNAQRQHELDHATAADAAHVELAHPDLARLTITARTPTSELWHRSDRDPEFLILRLGRGPAPSAVTIRRPASDNPGGGPDTGCERFIHPDVPVTIDLVAAQILGISGPRRSVLALARSLLGQISVLHSHRDVQIRVLTADPDLRSDWSWARWLPHNAGSSSRPLSNPSASLALRQQVIVLDGARALRKRLEPAAILTSASRSGNPPDGEPAPLLLCLDATEPDLPMECRATISLGNTPEQLAGSAPGETATFGAAPLGRALLRRAGAASARFLPDLASEHWAERLARNLAPLRDATPHLDQALPDTVRLIDLLTTFEQVSPTDPDALARHWRREGNRGVSGAVGMTADGPFRIDLRQHGPHLLIGGTTGSGKSELLQTLVTALAVDSAPDSLSFLLIDYKGGAAFRECIELPHVSAVITDLDPSLARRALASLTAELRYRERLLRRAASADLDGYQSARVTRPELPVLARLVVIVDEFRVLAEELPEFVGGLIRTATVGRSLGVHLVLATQRPTGIVSADISANVNLRIALRVNSSGDSRDLIDDPTAADLPTDRPGRALARSGAGPLIGFHTALVSGRPPEALRQPPTVRLLNLGVEPAPRPGLPPAPTGPGETEKPSDLTLVARAARGAVERLGLAPVRPPWPAPLPANLPLDDVLARDLSTETPTSSGHRRGVLRFPFALVDLPAEQRQDVLAWQMDGSHLAVAGGPRSGRSTTLHSVACAIAATAEVDEVHVYAIDGAGSLALLSRLPRVEAVVSIQDTERAQRLLRLLASEIEARQGAGGHLVNHGGGPDLGPDRGPDLVLLIDGWESLTGAWSTVDHGRLIDQLIDILRDGPAVGVQAVISGGRGLLTGAVSAHLSERVLLRFADPTDAILAGVPPALIPGCSAPGRGLVISPALSEPAQIQVATSPPISAPSPRPSNHPAPQPAASADVGTGSDSVRNEASCRPRAIRLPAVRRTWQIPELPRRLEHPHLIAAWHEQASAGDVRIRLGRRCVPVGIGGDEALALGLDLTAAGMSLVIGPGGSGRTSTLRCVADGLTRLHEPVIWVSFAGRGGPAGRDAPRRRAGPGARPERPGFSLLPDCDRDGNGSPSPDGAVLLNGVSVVDGSSPDAAARLAAAFSACPEVTVLVDETPAAGTVGGLQDGVEDLLTSHRATGHLVVASSAADVLGAYRGLLSVARTARSGLLLAPSGPGDGEVFGLRPERRPPGPPGRALLLQEGRTVNVQLALPPPESDTWARADPTQVAIR